MRRRLVLAAALGLILLIGYFDHVTAKELSLVALYLAPIAAVAWCWGRVVAVLVAILGSLSALIVDWLQWTSPESLHYFAFNQLTRALTFVAVAWLVGSVRRVMKDVKERGLEQAKAERELRTLTYAIAHHLRSPLRSIAAAGRAAATAPAERERAAALQELQRGVTRMAGLIDGLLAVAGIGGAELRREEIDLAEEARRICEDLRRKHPARAVECAIASPLRVHADRKFVGVILRALLDNAWKFSANVPAPRIAVGLETMGRADVYSVRDNGVGFDMSYSGKLFEPFQRLHKDNEFSGLGLGLSLALRAVERHGGRIWAQSEPGKGAAFFFTLAPAEEPQPRRAPSSEDIDTRP